MQNVFFPNLNDQVLTLKQPFKAAEGSQNVLALLVKCVFTLLVRKDTGLIGCRGGFTNEV